MSGGDKNRKKTSRGAQGWEEAGGEFYQESYPSTDTDFDVLQRDPKQLHTLLPSKQTRVAAATTVKRIRNTTDTKTFRRQTSTRTRSRRGSTARRPSQTADVQVSMLPDLSENLSNEEATWDEIMLIKELPISMSQKRDMKAKLQSEPNLRLQGYEHFKWKRRKMWDRFRSSLKEIRTKMEIWRSDLKKIESYCGTGVVTYFLFIKWLVLLDLVMFLIVLTFEICPYLMFVGLKSDCDLDQTNSTECLPPDMNSNQSDNGENRIFGLMEGTGWLERTIFFQGFYTEKILVISLNGNTYHYDFPLAYIFATLVCFFISLLAIVKSASTDFKQRLVEGEGQFYRYCNLVFGGWDFCIHNEKTANGKKRAILNEIKVLLDTERRKEERQNRTKKEKCKLYTVRLLVNVTVIAVLSLCAAAIYFVFDYSTKQSDLISNFNESNTNLENLAYEYMPSVSIVGLNLIVPFFFSQLVTFEKYSPATVVRITLIRTIFLRLFSLFVLYASLYEKIVCDPSMDVCKRPSCWEIFVGQHIYKLLLADFAVRIFVTFFINFPRALIAKKFNSKIAKFVGEQSFELPKHVLDVIYSQTLCWLGLFYAPLLPALGVVTFFLTFYVKKFTCLVNCKPTTTIYRVSRSNSMFMVVLLVSYVFALLPVTFAIAELVPSMSCGPFRGLDSVWSYVILWFSQVPWWLQRALFFVSTTGFAVPAFIVLILLLYYYWAVSGANRHMVIVLKNQLVLEGHDKQFLLDRLSMFIKQQHETQKRLRQAEMMRDGDRNISSN